MTIDVSRKIITYYLTAESSVINYVASFKQTYLKDLPKDKSRFVAAISCQPYVVRSSESVSKPFSLSQ